MDGTWNETRWNHVIFYRAKKTAADAVASMLSSLSHHAAFLAGIRRTGGRISLDLNLPGASHRGESLGIATLRIAAELGIDNGFEVFPDWDGQPAKNQVRGK